MSAFNTTISHKAFAVPVFVQTLRLLDRTLDKILSLDIKTRNILITTDKFLINSNTDRIYVKRSVDIRNIRSRQRAF